MFIKIWKYYVYAMGFHWKERGLASRNHFKYIEFHGTWASILDQPTPRKP